MRNSPIALVIPSLKVGGMERVMSELANYFIKENIAISFVVADLAKYKSVTYEERTINDGVTEKETVNTLNADLNVFNNFFGEAKFGIMFKF